MWLWLLVNHITEGLCDSSDWVSVGYIVSETRQPGLASDSTTAAALDSIIRGADQLVAKGPWSITDDKSSLSPNENSHDYLSWAPYHWPDCQWCTSKSKVQAMNSSFTDELNPGTDEQEYFGNVVKSTIEYAFSPHRGARRRMLKVHSRYRTKRQEVTAENRPSATVASTLLTVPSTVASNTNRLSATKSASQAPTEAVAKPTKATCTPSPTTSMPPSATWTSCPYVGRDGKVNPDVRNLNGPGSINNMAQYVLYGSIAFTAKKDAKYSQGVVKVIDTFFLNSSTKMNPNVKFGQVVRGVGPEGKKGTFTGVLDVRGVIKVVNGILILKSGGSSEWTNAKDQEMRNWMLEYSRWLQDSDIGAVTSTRPNNHCTFYVAQLATAKFYTGDKQGAIDVLQHFFQNEFRDQIAASGEQPFEGIRTRPLHYRSFNLEALIMIAKLGDFLGVDFWSAQSRYGATIQTALDYAFTCDPKSEDVEDLIPHVAAVAAAYGDPKGKYRAFLKKHMDNYESRPFWFYDQTAALTKAPTSGKAKRSVTSFRDNDGADDGSDDDEGDSDNPGNGPVDKGPTKIPFGCPAAFKTATVIEIDNGVFVTCDQLRPLYDSKPVPVGVT